MRVGIAKRGTISGDQSGRSFNRDPTGSAWSSWNCRGRAPRWGAVKRAFRASVFVAMACALICSSTVIAQAPPKVHYLHHEFLPPGVIGQEQLRRHAGMPGYFQAVELTVPEGAQISVIEDGGFRQATPGPILVGMQVGLVYSLKLSQLPNREGVELFPTVEIINRLYPPTGTKTRFPVPIEFTEEDIGQALSGLFVTRIVYLEDNDQALQVADDPKHQRSIDVAPNEDPLHVADRLGRPMAIVRLGSRVPEESELGVPGLTPPIQVYPAPKSSNKTGIVKDAIERHEDIPRSESEK